MTVEISSTAKTFAKGDGPFRTADLVVKKDLMGHTINLVLTDVVEGAVTTLLTFLEKELQIPQPQPDQP